MTTFQDGKGKDRLDETKQDELLFDDAELDRIFNQEASLVSREAEVMRVLACFKLNPYEILDLNWMPKSGVTDADIQRAYRKKSLLIHPDKLKHPRGIEAFDLLKKVRLNSTLHVRGTGRRRRRNQPRLTLLLPWARKQKQAQTELSDPEKRKPLDETLQDARMLVLREIGLPRETPDDHEKLNPPAMKDPDLKERVRRKAKEIMIDDELRKRRVQKMTMIAEGAEAKRVEDAVAERKRKMEEKERWEETREDRVWDWRSFNKKKKKRTKGPEVLG
ncbi:hypothetical protein BMF94_0447 [Rhodotorula taiwanensis]|uniref:J domain-containing protein n=1 Tax=Rhodotorula taiwanensis TaxID=741276 RepID=A0A2S5BHL3_9BASI|nr:hypothetical protein BMF94_0447 [Rhodotorula taiwanensis]